MSARVWITRTRPGADRTAQRLRALGLTPVVAPLLTVQPLAPALPDLDRYAALVFTSPNGVAAYAALTPRRDHLVFTIGDATAADAGVAEVPAGEVPGAMRVFRDAAWRLMGLSRAPEARPWLANETTLAVYA